MRNITLEQGSQAWLEWRKKLLTATDAPMLLGKSPYVTPYKGWQRKLGLIPEQSKNAAMQRGIEDEPIARKMFFESHGIESFPAVIESDKYDFLGASLDGLSTCGKYIIEIKSNGNHYHDNLSDRGVPEFHWIQMQHQLLCSDGQCEIGYYVSYNNGEIKVIEVKFDAGWCESYIPLARQFWRKVIFYEAPDLSYKDYVDMDGVSDWSEVAQKYREISQELKELENQKEFFRLELIRLCGNENAAGAGVKVMKKITKGRVDYNSIPEIREVDLDKYRKENSFAWTITLDRSRA